MRLRELKRRRGCDLRLEMAPVFLGFIAALLLMGNQAVASVILFLSALGLELVELPVGPKVDPPAEDGKNVSPPPETKV